MPTPKPFSDWSSWAPLPFKVDPAVLATILDDGQAFRWHRLPDTTWLGFWGAHCARLRLNEQGLLEWSAHLTQTRQTGLALLHYLALESDFDGITDSLPWRSDAHLAACIAAMPGLRLLHQPFGETLLCFLCSATKQIPQICAMAEAMAREIGSPPPYAPPREVAALELSFHKLPTWNQLALASEKTLRDCALGFRATNVLKTARFLDQNPGWLETTEALPYPEAHARLCELAGVGPKIADCVLLYGGAKLESFPVDTWIINAMGKRYGLTDWPPAHIAHFGRQHFGPAAGLAQQFIFNFERKQSKTLG